ncbi:MAG: hydantoinase B/oxoprolinase family protein, partial [Proteobacteria bacterium]|nr:hydantoinase B/oxoprolinase family protein [Pseudomonadota bacterium]
FEGAKRYCVVLTQTGEVDKKATKDMRKDMAAKRGKIKVFDFGPSIEELRKTCEEDTGLPAPVAPVWS